MFLFHLVPSPFKSHFPHFVSNDIRIPVPSSQLQTKGGLEGNEVRILVLGSCGQIHTCMQLTNTPLTWTPTTCEHTLMQTHPSCGHTPHVDTPLMWTHPHAYTPFMWTHPSCGHTPHVDTPSCIHTPHVDTPLMWTPLMQIHPSCQHIFHVGTPFNHVDTFANTHTHTHTHTHTRTHTHTMPYRLT